MTLRDPGVYLEDIEYYAAAAVRFTSGYSTELDHHKVYSIAIASAPELLTAVQEALKDFPDPTSDNDKETRSSR